jgi:hypothetical protein
VTARTTTLTNFSLFSLVICLSLILSNLVAMDFVVSDYIPFGGGKCYSQHTNISTNFFDQKAWDLTMVCTLLRAQSVLASTIAACDKQARSLY